MTRQFFSIGGNTPLGPDADELRHHLPGEHSALITRYAIHAFDAAVSFACVRVEAV